MNTKQLLNLENIVKVYRKDGRFFVHFSGVVTGDVNITLPVYTEAQNVSRTFKAVKKVERNVKREVTNEISGDQAKALILAGKEQNRIVNEFFTNNDNWEFQFKG